MKARVLDTMLETTSYPHATAQIQGWATADESRIVVAANVHVVMEAHDKAAVRAAIASADLVAPDGMPLVWLMRLNGAKGQERVYGPSLMLHVLEVAEQEGIPVGFYGSEPEVLAELTGRMQMRSPRLKIVYAYSPPFRELSEEEDVQIVEAIRKSGARILFIGLGCPKQELWMAEHRGKISAVMLGVGAAFDFHAGMKKQAPGWMQKAGLEWLFRLLGEPRRLWKRYLYNNPRFMVLATLDLLGLYRAR